jgi:hypothetical protein
VIALFTKFDALDNEAYSTLIKKAYDTIVEKEITSKDARKRAREEARTRAPHLAETDFHRVHLDRLYKSTYPPKGHVYLRGESFFLCAAMDETPQLVLRHEQTTSYMP